MDRRTVLAGIVAGSIAAGGCDLLSADPPPPHPLSGLLRQTRTLLDRYQETIAAHPALAERLRPPRDDHQAHVDELARLIGPRASASPSAKPAATTPADQAAALLELVNAESAAQQQAVKVCLSAKPEYAGLIGSIAACRATHRDVLG